MRYIGCKTKLLDIIESEINKFCGNIVGKTFCDIFCGTSAVGDFFQDKCKIISKDNLYFCYIIARAKLLGDKCTFDKLGFDPFVFFNNYNANKYKDGFVYQTFAPEISNRQYFSDQNAKLIDYIRDTIEFWYKDKLINDIKHDYLLGCLLESISKVSNVAGVYAAYLNKWDSRALKPMKFIRVEQLKKAAYENKVYNFEVNDLIKNIEGDILYLDPPYTPTQYISQYHVLCYSALYMMSFS